MKKLKGLWQEDKGLFARVGAALVVFAGVMLGVCDPITGVILAATLPTKSRSMIVTRNSVAVASVRTKSIKVNGEPIDITTDDDAGWKKLLEEPALVSAEISVSGILKNELLATEAVNTTDRAQTTSFSWPGAASAGKLEGNFFLTNFSITGEYQGAATFEATFVSSGAVAFTAAA